MNNYQSWSNAKKVLTLHLTVGIICYLSLAFFDGYFTLKGMGGDISLEGNPLMRHIMLAVGPCYGLILVKTTVFLIALFLAVTAFIGIKNEKSWVYFLALTEMTRNWMRCKKRYWVAFVPIYLVALSQGMAAISWILLMA